MLGAPPLSQTAPDPRYVLYFQTRSGTGLVKKQPERGVCSVAESPRLCLVRVSNENPARSLAGDLQFLRAA
jgi:hypothetical protein